MATTWQELLEALRDVDEIEFLELLDLDTSDLILYCKERIAERESYIRHQLGLEG